MTYDRHGWEKYCYRLFGSSLHGCNQLEQRKSGCRRGTAEEKMTPSLSQKITTLEHLCALHIPFILKIKKGRNNHPSLTILNLRLVFKQTTNVQHFYRHHLPSCQQLYHHEQFFCLRHECSLQT